jgi:hypothetical protein
MRTDIDVIKVPLDGRDLKKAIIDACKLQAARDPDPRRLVSTFIVPTTENSQLLLVFDLFDQK